MFKRIVLPVDGSVNSEKAVNMAANLQKLHDSEIIILNVYRHHSLREQTMSMVRPMDPEPMDRAQRDYAREIVDWARGLAEQKGADRLTTKTRSGQPAREIVKLAKEVEADLIILGSRGLGDWQGFLLGSVSHKVTSLSNIPVLVV